MRCPKCHYIGFDSNDRCRNCGYEFSLAVDVGPRDLPIQTGDEAIGPLSDFALTDRAGPALESSSDAHRPHPRSDRRSGASWVTHAAQQRSGISSLDLPLFKDRAFNDDAPLVSVPAVPRAPVSVRRASPVLQRARDLEEPELDLDGLSFEHEPAPLSHAASRPLNEKSAEPIVVASPGARVIAAALDAIILGTIGFIVVYFTLEVCGLAFSELALLPRVPLGAFLLLLGGGYFVLFTAAGGQTIGKMAAGIRVVPIETDAQWSDRVPLARAVLRAVGYFASLLPAGLGFLPALFGPQRRAVHDRLADTRVVKA